MRNNWSVLAHELVVLAFCAMVITLPFFWSESISTYQFAKKIMFCVTVLLAAPFAALSLIASPGAHSWEGRVSSPVILWVIFIVLGIISSTTAQNPHLAGEMIMEWSSYALLFLLSRRFERKDAGRIMFCVTLSVFAISIYTFFEYGGIIKSRWASGQPVATVGNPNFLGEYLVIAAPMAASWGFFNSHRFGILFAGTASAMGVLAGVLTYSRGTWLGLAVALALAAFHGFRGRLNRKTMIRLTAWSLVAVAGFIAWPRVSERIAPMLVSQDRTGDFRLLTWQGTLRLARVNLLMGIGPGNYPIRYDRFRPFEETSGISGHDAWVKNPHNDYLHILSENGLAGLFVFLAIILTVLKKSIIKFADGTIGNEQLFLLAGMAGTIAQASVSSNFFRALAASHFWIAAAVLCVADKWGSKHNEIQETVMTGVEYSGEAVKMPEKVFVLSAFLFSVAAAVPVLVLMESDYHFTRGFQLRKKAATQTPGVRIDQQGRNALNNQALEAYGLSMKLQPSRMDAPFEVARIYGERGELKSAEVMYLRLLTLYPEYRNALNNLANIMVHHGRVDEAEQIYIRSLEINQAYPLAHSNLGVIYLQKALDAAAKSRAKNTGGASLPAENSTKNRFTSLPPEAEALGRKGHDHLVRCLALKPFHPEAMRNMGVMYLYLYGDRGRARVWFTRYIEVNSGAQDVDYIRSILRSL